MLFAVFVIPESPKFMYSHKRFNEARQTLAWIAKKNGSKKADEISGIIFDSEETVNEMQREDS